MSKPPRAPARGGCRMEFAFTARRRPSKEKVVVPDRFWPVNRHDLEGGVVGFGLKHRNPVEVLLDTPLFKDAAASLNHHLNRNTDDEETHDPGKGAHAIPPEDPKQEIRLAKAYP